jgi:hypothetical protein
VTADTILKLFLREGGGALIREASDQTVNSGRIDASFSGPTLRGLSV